MKKKKSLRENYMLHDVRHEYIPITNEKSLVLHNSKFLEIHLTF